jgi:hypothetical protein
MGNIPLITPSAVTQTDYPSVIHSNPATLINWQNIPLEQQYTTKKFLSLPANHMLDVRIVSPKHQLTNNIETQQLNQTTTITQLSKEQLHPPFPSPTRLPTIIGEQKQLLQLKFLKSSITKEPSTNQKRTHKLLHPPTQLTLFDITNFKDIGQQKHLIFGDITPIL